MNDGTVFYTYLDSPIGRILVAGDGEAVSRISFTTGHQVRHPEPAGLNAKQWLLRFEGALPAPDHSVGHASPLRNR